MSLGLKTWTQGETLTYTDLNSNFTKISNKINSLSNSDFASDAGITSDKLQDRFAVCYQTITIPPVFYDGTDLVYGEGTSVEIQDTATMSNVEDLRIYPEIPGKRAYLCAINGYMGNIAANSSVDNIGVYIYKNNSLITGSAIRVDPSDGADQTFTVKTSSPFSSPVDELQNGDYLSFKIAKEEDTDSHQPSFDSLSITFTYKVELVG